MDPVNHTHEGDAARGGTPSTTDRAYSVLAHMTSFLGYTVPLGQFLGPYSIQLIRGGDSEFVLAHTREVLNFQITILLLLLVGFVLSPVGIGWLIILAALVHSLIQTIRGAQAASRLEPFRYPWSIRLVS